MTDEPVSLEERRLKRAVDTIMEELRPAQKIAQTMHEARENPIDYIATAFDLCEPYDRRVLSLLLLAGEQWEEPPFMWLQNMGLMWRGYNLARRVATDLVQRRADEVQPLRLPCPSNRRCLRSVMLRYA